VKKLDDCSEMVSAMKLELEELQPFLQLKTKQTEDIMKRVEEENVEAQRQRELVQEDEI